MFAAVFVAEIEDVGWFSTADKLYCWAGLTPRHRESDITVHRGRITKMTCGRCSTSGPAGCNGVVVPHAVCCRALRCPSGLSAPPELRTAPEPGNLKTLRETSGGGSARADPPPGGLGVARLLDQ